MGFDFLLIAIVVIGITFFFSKRYKKTEKVDKDFAVSYYKLSYRRKMIRTLTSIPFIIVACGVLYYLSDWPLPIYFGFVGLISVIFLVQVLYNYKMWKKEEQG
ncbi:hypothetical protein MHL30_18200 [Priestia flexa]|uniref:hypothetical protein n=1 Tax=Priestia flexa TaxID=86664 RepID=UPI0013D3DCDE|nr:hypothetical protein [Priestia flexa]MCG7315050.1 hypothetical protein [Priestia flexa]